jgi:hypothetical protein
MHARKGLVVDKRKEKKWHNKSLTGMLEVEVEREANSWDRYRTVPSVLTDGADPDKETIWISAYNVIDFWDRYEQEREHLYGEQLRRMEEQEKERRDREAARIEQMQIRERAKKDLQTKIEKGLSLPEGSVTIGENTVVINRAVLESRFSEKVVY